MRKFVRKRLLPAMLAAAMVFSQGAVSFAANSAKETGAEETVSRKISRSYDKVNPLYPGTSSRSVHSPGRSSSVDPTSFVGSAQTYTSSAEAGAYVREELIKRNTPIVVNYTAAFTTEEAHRSMVDEIWDYAMQETGATYSGDYLAYQYGKYHLSEEGTVSGTTFTGTLTYDVDYYTTSAQEQQVTAKVQQVISGLNIGSSTSYEKITAIYDYICDHVTYDHANLKDDSYTLKYTAYGALMNGTAVCQGYAVLLYRMLREVGVPVRVISGLGISDGKGEAHAWNIAGIGGKYYYLDSTWDTNYREAHEPYEYFLRGSTDFVDHQAEAKRFDSSFWQKYPLSEKQFDPSVPVTETTTEAPTTTTTEAPTAPTTEANPTTVTESTTVTTTESGVTPAPGTPIAPATEGAAPVLAAPKGLSAKSDLNGVTVSWKAVQGASSYTVYRVQGKKKAKVGTTSGTSLTDRKAKNGTEYTYQVEASGAGYQTSKASASAKLLYLAVPGKVKAKAGKKSATVTWKKNAKSGGYQIRYSLKSSMKGAKTVKVKKPSTVKNVLKKLKSGKNYYVQVRCYKTVGKKTWYSAWSKAVKAN